MNRRKFFENTFIASAGISIGLIPRISFTMNPDVYQFKIGKAKCIILRDLMFSYKASDYFINAEESKLKEYVDTYRFNPEKIESPFIALLIEIDDKRILIDTGSGYSDSPITFRGRTFPLKGRLLSLLEESGISNNSITDVIITHFHPDHIGGIITDEIPNFPNARFHLHEKEWEYWTTAKSVNENPLFKLFVDNNIKPLSDLDLNLIRNDESEIISGITSIIAPGHTPGQIAVDLRSQGESLLYTSDAFLHPIHIEELNWKTNYDKDHKVAKKTRKKLLRIAQSENSIINSFHFDFPGLGFAEKKNNKWKWTPKE